MIPKLDHFTELEIEHAKHNVSLPSLLFLSRIGTIYRDVKPGGKKLDDFTCREIVVSRVMSDADGLREIEKANVQLDDGELDTHFHEVGCS